MERYNGLGQPDPSGCFVRYAAAQAALTAKDAEIARLTGERNAALTRAERAEALHSEAVTLSLTVLDRAERAEAALAESEAKLAVAYETAATKGLREGLAAYRKSNVAVPPSQFYADAIRALATEDQTTALAAYVKQHVEAETRACAEVCSSVASLYGELQGASKGKAARDWESMKLAALFIRDTILTRPVQPVVILVTSDKHLAQALCFKDCAAGKHLDFESGCCSVCRSQEECTGWVPYLGQVREKRLDQPAGEA